VWYGWVMINAMILGALLGVVGWFLFSGWEKPNQ